MDLKPEELYKIYYAAMYEAVPAAVAAALSSCTAADPPCSTCVAAHVIDAIWPAAYRAGREEAARDIQALREDQKQRAAANSDKFVRAMRAPFNDPNLPGIKTHGWTLGGRVEALEEAVKVARGGSGDQPRTPQGDVAQTPTSGGEQ